MPSKNMDELPLEENGIVHQPKPFLFKRSHANFLEDANDNPTSLTHKRFCPDSATSSIAQWIETTSVSEAERLKSCRSDSFLERQYEEKGSRKRSKSVSDMAYQHTPGTLAVPSAPASARSRSSGPSRVSSATSTTSWIVKDPAYHSRNLGTNNIHLRDNHEDLPTEIEQLCEDHWRDRDSPAPPEAEVRRNRNLQALERGAAKTQIEEYFRRHIFPATDVSDDLLRHDRVPMNRANVPGSFSTFHVSTPAPGMLYGYQRRKALAEQQTYLFSMNSMDLANAYLLAFPFFAIEFKGDDPLWVATNQCMASSATCVNVAENINKALRECGSQNARQINSAAFSIAMNASVANLYVTWKHDDLKYYTQKVRAFCLQEPDHYLEFRKRVRNIIDWGKNARLESIREALDFLLEESRRSTEEVL